MSRNGRRAGGGRYSGGNGSTKRIALETLVAQALDEPARRPDAVYVSSPRDLMNKTEREFVDIYLDPLIASGELHCWRYEPCSFRLGHDCHYQPDFLLVYADGRIELVEIKGGFVREDAVVKIKAFVTVFPFIPLFVARKVKGVWSIDRVKHGGPTWS